MSRTEDPTAVFAQVGELSRYVQRQRAYAAAFPVASHDFDTALEGIVSPFELRHLTRTQKGAIHGQLLNRAHNIHQVRGLAELIHITRGVILFDYDLHPGTHIPLGYLFLVEDEMPNEVPAEFLAQPPEGGTQIGAKFTGTHYGILWASEGAWLGMPKDVESAKKRLQAHGRKIRDEYGLRVHQSGRRLVPYHNLSDTQVHSRFTVPAREEPEPAYPRE